MLAFSHPRIPSKEAHGGTCTWIHNAGARTDCDDERAPPRLVTGRARSSAQANSGARNRCYRIVPLPLPGKTPLGFFHGLRCASPVAIFRDPVGTDWEMCRASGGCGAVVFPFIVLRRILPPFPDLCLFRSEACAGSVRSPAATRRRRQLAIENRTASATLRIRTNLPRVAAVGET
jgi:hypothetical protein